MTFGLRQTLPFTVDLTGLTGGETEFENALPHPPDLNFPVHLTHVGVGMLAYVDVGETPAPAAGQFTLYGTEKRHLRLGRARKPQETLYGTQVVAQ